MANSKRNRSKSSSQTTDPKRASADRAEQSRLEEKILPWTSITRKQADQFVSITTTGAWVSIGILVLFWVTIRFIGPSLGWWVLTG
jgi:Protein of unknown function (DUF2839)